MDEDEPGAVDARSIYIGNVRTQFLQSVRRRRRAISTYDSVCYVGEADQQYRGVSRR